MHTLHIGDINDQIFLGKENFNLSEAGLAGNQLTIRTNRADLLQNCLSKVCIVMLELPYVFKL